MSTVQAPQSPVPHPYLVPVRFDASRSAVFQGMFLWQEGLDFGSASVFGAAVEVRAAAAGEHAVAKVEITLEAASTADGGIGGGRLIEPWRKSRTS